VLFVPLSCATALGKSTRAISLILFPAALNDGLGEESEKDTAQHSLGVMDKVHMGERHREVLILNDDQLAR
jgi:hypothetical protein